MIRQSSIISMSIQQSNCCIVFSILGEPAKMSGAIVIYLFEIYDSFLTGHKTSTVSAIKVTNLNDFLYHLLFLSGLFSG